MNSANAGLNHQWAAEGKEVRFGIAQSAMTTTTSFTTGTAVANNMHDTADPPLGGMIPLYDAERRHKAVGLMIMYAILAVFICGLIGRTRNTSARENRRP